MPAFSAHLRVFACAASLHTAGTVITNSKGVFCNALLGTLYRKTCSPYFQSAVRKSVTYFSALASLLGAAAIGSAYLVANPESLLV